MLSLAYETLHGVDLYHNCVKNLSGKIAQIMKLNGRIRRMDSMMIESNIRFLSRMELIYTCISKLVILLTKDHPDWVVESLKHYANPNNYNRIFYHQRNDDMGQSSKFCWQIATTCLIYVKQILKKPQNISFFSDAFPTRQLLKMETAV